MYDVPGTPYTAVLPCQKCSAHSCIMSASIYRFQVHTGKETLVLIFKNRHPPSAESTSKEVKLTRKSNRLEITV